MSETCNYNLAWIGNCKNPAVENGKCAEHKDLKCCSCGEPATHQCAETGQFVCGAELCDDCEHTIHSNGTNGGIGFFRVGELPAGYKEHCKKSEQVYKPWYVTEVEKLEMFDVNIGKRVKKISNRPFKSTFYINTVKGVINHPTINIPAYTFEEDDSYVECRRCEVVEDTNLK